MISQSGLGADVQIFRVKSLVAEPIDSRLTSDAGLLPVREFGERIGLTQQFAEALGDPPDLALTGRLSRQMGRSWIVGILADYEDQNNYHTLRSVAVFKLIAGRSSDATDLASQPTFSRFENSISLWSRFRLQKLFVDQFMASFDEPPGQLIFDIDTCNDPAHGDQ